MTFWLFLTVTFVTASSPLIGWRLEPPWEMTTHALLPTPLLHVPILLKGTDDQFLLAQGRFGLESAGDALSPLLPASSSSRILTFKYAKVGAADLQILLKEGESYRLLDSISEQTGSKWHERTTLLPPGNEDQQLLFRARGILDGLDAVAISSVQIKSSPTSVLSVAKNLPKGIRRKPTNLIHCEPIECSFHQTTCQWSFHGFTPLDGKVVSKENGLMSTEPIILPASAHFQMEIFVGEHASAAVYQRLGSEEQLLWTAGGMSLPGWNTIRLPLRLTSFPSKIIIKSVSLGGGYVSVRNTRLVNEFGTSLSCGQNVPAIRPRNDGTIRLTAVQKLDLELPVLPQLHHSASATAFTPRFFRITTTTTEKPSTVQQPAATFMKSIDDNKIKSLSKKFGLSERAITPINGYSKKADPSLALAALGLPQSLQKALSEKLSQFIELPASTSSRESRPFSREQMDWIVSHSFNNFIKQARP